MPRASTLEILGLLAASALPLGCGGSSPAGLHPVTINPTPGNVLNPAAPGAKAEAKAPDGPKAPAIKPTALPAAESAAAPAESAPEVRLVAIKFDELKGRIAANQGARLTMVDVWSTTCGPCMENFPHVVEMNAKYAGKGLAVVSLSMDPPDEPRAVQQAEKFLREKKATFTNFRLSEPPEAAYDGLEFFALPAVFLFAPDGTLLEKFTWDDPNNQFTYDEVEKAVEARLNAKPADAKG